MSNSTITSIVDDITSIVAQYPGFILDKQLFDKNNNYKLTVSHPLLVSEHWVYATSEQSARQCRISIKDYLERMSTSLTSVITFANYFGNEFEVKQINAPENRIQMRHRRSKKLVSVVLTLDTITLYRHINIAPTDPSVSGIKQLSILHQIETYLRPTPMRVLYERIETELARPITDYVQEIKSSDLQPNLV